MQLQTPTAVQFTLLEAAVSPEFVLTHKPHLQRALYSVPCVMLSAIVEYAQFCFFVSTTMTIYRTKWPTKFIVKFLLSASHPGN